MTVFVDPVFGAVSSNPQAARHGKEWCHMTCDGDLDELHRLARRIGLKREWFQNKGSIPHYDLTPSKRFLAVQHGAIQKTTSELRPLTRWWLRRSASCGRDWNKLQKPYEIFETSQQFEIIDRP